MTKDKLYLDAVARGDKAACQRMVDEAAEAWAPKSVVRTPDGKLGPVYRGLRLRKPIDWDLMHTEDVSERYALVIGTPPEPKATPSFTPDREIAQAYSGFLSSDFFGEKVSHRIDPKRSKVLAVYLNITNPFDARKSQEDDHRLHLHYLYDFLVKSDDDASMFIEGIGEAAKWQAWDQQTTAKGGGYNDEIDLEDLYDRAGYELEEGGYAEAGYVFQEVYIDPHAIADSASFVELLESKGYDGMLFNGPFDIGPQIGIDKTVAEEWRPFHGCQIKSSNPITWADRKHTQVIPISQRFQKPPGKEAFDYEHHSRDARYNPGKDKKRKEKYVEHPAVVQRNINARAMRIGKVGQNMKGIYYKGDCVVWDIAENGEPDHTWIIDVENDRLNSLRSQTSDRTGVSAFLWGYRPQTNSVYFMLGGRARCARSAMADLDTMRDIVGCYEGIRPDTKAIAYFRDDEHGDPNGWSYFSSLVNDLVHWKREPTPEKFRTWEKDTSWEENER